MKNISELGTPKDSQNTNKFYRMAEILLLDTQNSFYFNAWNIRDGICKVLLGFLRHGTSLFCLRNDNIWNF